eukprot:6787594-Karenia_brevis.AAC.1
MSGAAALEQVAASGWLHAPYWGNAALAKVGRASRAHRRAMASFDRLLQRQDFNLRFRRGENPRLL